MVPSGTDIQFIISIHSTARVETDIPQTNIYILEISIHSTARVETSSILAGSMSLYYLNPLHREGGDANWLFRG